MWLNQASSNNWNSFLVFYLIDRHKSVAKEFESCECECGAKSIESGVAVVKGLLIELIITDLTNESHSALIIVTNEKHQRKRSVTSEIINNE